MGMFKDLRKIMRIGKQLEKEQFGASSPLGMMRQMGQTVATASDAVQDVEAQHARAQRLQSGGIEGTATIRGMRDTGTVVNTIPVIEFDLEVRLEGRQPYSVTSRQVIPHAALNRFQLGSEVSVKVDPEDRTSLLVQ
jgi:hypothetical protein